MGPSLAADQVSVSFDGLHALSNVSLDVPREKVTGLIGPKRRREDDACECADRLSGAD